MTDDQAREVVDLAEIVANGIVKSLVRMTTPDVAITALGLASGVVFASLSIEDGTSFEEVLGNWIEALKMQYIETQNNIEAAKQAAH